MRISEDTMRLLVRYGDQEAWRLWWTTKDRTYTCFGGKLGLVS